jgi:hypothetical protein
MFLRFTQYIADSDNPKTYPPPALIDWPLDPASFGLQPEAVIRAAGFKPDDNPSPQFGRLNDWWRNADQLPGRLQRLQATEDQNASSVRRRPRGPGRRGRTRNGSPRGRRDHAGPDVVQPPPSDPRSGRRGCVSLLLRPDLARRLIDHPQVVEGAKHGGAVAGPVTTDTRALRRLARPCARVHESH